jgi:hypothetical protein
MTTLLILAGLTGLLLITLWLRRSNDAPVRTTPAQRSPRWQKRNARNRLVAWLRNLDQANTRTLSPESLAELKAWVIELSPDELRDWERTTNAFCKAANIELNWLWGNELERDPDLRNAIGDVVLGYTLSYYRARRTAPSLAAVKALRFWRSAPFRGKRRRFGDELHAHLVQQGLITVPGELFLASNRRRRQEAVNSMKRLDDEQRLALRAAVTQMLSGVDTAPSIPTTQDKASYVHKLPPIDARVA